MGAWGPSAGGLFPAWRPQAGCQQRPTRRRVHATETPETSRACFCPRGEMSACFLLPCLIGAGVYFLSKAGTLFFYPCGRRATPRTLEGCVDTWGQCPILNAGGYPAL